MKFLKNYLLFLTLILSSCLDMITDDEIKVVGNIHLLHTAGTTVSGYTLDYKIRKNTFQSVISEDIISLRGNDSVLFVKSFTDNDTTYYKISHQSGLKILNSSSIPKDEFLNRIKDLKFQYNYNALKNQN